MQSSYKAYEPQTPDNAIDSLENGTQTAPYTLLPKSAPIARALDRGHFFLLLAHP